MPNIRTSPSTATALPDFRAKRNVAADDMQLMDWLEKKIWPAEDRLDSDVVYAQTMLGIAEMIRCGTTSFADMYFFMTEDMSLSAYTSRLAE